MYDVWEDMWIPWRTLKDRVSTSFSVELVLSFHLYVHPRIQLRL